MGRFDSILIECPKCGTQIKFQSKAGLCELKEYDIQTVPDSIAGDIIGDEQDCPNCNATIKIAGKVMIYPYISLSWNIKNKKAL